MLEEGAEGVGAAGAVGADPVRGPATVVDRVVRLHRGDHPERREAVEVLRRHVLRVLDPQAAVGGAVRFLDLFVQVEHGRDPLVADGMHADLQAGGVGAHQPFAHRGDRVHLVRQQAA
jgi:hypothetical protein